MAEEKQKIEIEEILNKDENDFDYDFLKNPESENLPPTNEEIIMAHFNNAYNKSHPYIQEYILSEKFKNDVIKILTLENINDEKHRIILENIISSLLVGIIKKEEIKDLLFNSFLASEIKVQISFIDKLIVEINKYILREVREKIVEKKIEKKIEMEEIKTLPIKTITGEEKEKIVLPISTTEKIIKEHKMTRQEKEEKMKVELRKILLDNSKKTDRFIEYQEKKDIEAQKPIEKSEIRKPEFNRENLLNKIDDQEILDISKESKNQKTYNKYEKLNINDLENRLQKIKEKEEERSAQIQKEKEEENKKLEEERKKEENENQEKITQKEKEEKEKERLEYLKKQLQKRKEEEEMKKIEEIEKEQLKNQEISEALIEEIQGKKNSDFIYDPENLKENLKEDSLFEDAYKEAV